MPGAPEEPDRLAAAYARRAADDPRYSAQDPAQALALAERERAVLRLLAHRELGALDILDLGCGTGGWLRDLVRWGATPGRLVGVDPLPERIERARATTDPGIQLEVAQGTALPFPAASFDLVVLSLVCSSILDPAVRLAVATEAQRVLRPGGAVLWYDFFYDNPANPDVRGIGRREIARLFPGTALHLHRITLAPPIARRVAPWSPGLARFLGACPLLRSHYLGLIRLTR